MTIGYILLAFGMFQTAWMVWEIRRHDPARVGLAQRVMDDILRRSPRPKSDLSILIERSSYWVGLFVGPVIMSLGLIFIFSE